MFFVRCIIIARIKHLIAEPVLFHAQMHDLCIEKYGLGYQVFNAGNDNATANVPTMELAKRFFPNVPFTREIGEFEALYSNRKIREVLGFKEEHNWRLYVD